MKKEVQALIVMIVLPIVVFQVSYNSGFNNAMKNRQQPVATTSVYSDYFPEWEVAEIMDACRRNNLEPQLVSIVFAIRKAENGVTKPFGIMNPEADTYSKQAGWCVCTVQKNYDRWLKDNQGKEFIDFLGDRYCPAEVDPEGNKNWKKNVRYWTNKLNERAGD